MCQILAAALPNAVEAGASSLCGSAARTAASATNVPFPVLMAITKTETGRDGEPWPWTVNIDGQGYWLDSQQEALDIARSALDRGQTSFDLGCFQINFRWHSEHFTSLEDMLDPAQGASYAARFLSQLYDETGSWSEAAGRYHSRTPQRADNYRKRFDAYLAEVENEASMLRNYSNGFPLLHAGSGQSELGSLVPISNGDSG